MNITISNCNNVSKGEISIEEGKVNLKYGINGTGKSTVAKALELYFSEKPLDELKPYSQDEFKPNVNVIPDKKLKVALFNESYVNNYVFQPSELITNSFEIFVKNQEYQDNLDKIEILTKSIKDTFNENKDLDSLISVLDGFITSFGRATGKISAAGQLSKGLGNGNLIENIPTAFSSFAPFIQHTANVKYIGWQANGIEYLDIADACPFCSQHLESEGQDSKNTIRKMTERYNSNNIRHLNTVLQIFEELSEYFSEGTKKQIESFCKNSEKMSQQEQEYLLEIKMQAENLNTSLKKVKNIGFNQLKEVDDMVSSLKDLSINIELLSHFKESKITADIVETINNKLSDLLTNANELKAAINRQKKKIKESIFGCENEINTFLSNAGFRYNVKIQEKFDYKILLYPKDCVETIENVSNHLSYGERNALALLLFAYQAEHDNANLIILDDPISSFDGNKKFAIINSLFMKGLTSRCKLTNKTVLMLTHDFCSVIDMGYTMNRKLSCKIKSTYISCNSSGVLSDQPIESENILSCVNALNKVFMAENLHIASRLAALRRYKEIVEGKNDYWDYLSSVLHKEKPKKKSEDDVRVSFSNDEMKEMEEIIASEYIYGYDYEATKELFEDRYLMLSSYKESNNSYEKLQLFRIIQGNQGTDNDVINKYINETFHVENDYLFQLDPFEYEQVPDFVIAECDKILNVS